MKKIIFVGLIASVFACSNKKKEVEGNIENPSQEFYSGTVTNKYNDKGCDYLIEMETGHKHQLLHPIDLKEEFKKDGEKIKFTYRPIKAPNTDDCRLGLFVKINDYK